MKKPDPIPPDPNAGLGLELSRRRTAHHARDAARILVDVMHLVPFEDRGTYTKIVGELNTYRTPADRSHAGTEADAMNSPHFAAGWWLMLLGLLAWCLLGAIVFGLALLLGWRL
ncbi:MAG TPA: hypothetical protein VN857_09510 [Chthoniobacterales bacterium]|nr:hypothetical protein [Chthoniobacterales bacterium]